MFKRELYQFVELLRHNIPRSTLSDRVTGKVKETSHSGPTRYLSDEEEAELVHFLTGSALMGYARTKKDVMAIADQIIERKGIKKCPVSNGWWESFRKRHPHLTLRTVEKLSYARFIATDQRVIDQYFDLLKDTLTNNKLLDRPSQIFNCDETGLPLQHSFSSVVGVKGQKHPRSITTGTKKHISVLACANAGGYVLPQLVIFSRKGLSPELTKGEVPSTMYGLSDNGWMTGEIFENWFAHHFLVHTPATRPLLLLLDGHSTHYNPSFIRRAQEKVIVFCLPPNTTHLIQPLDKGVFGPLKVYWNQECHRYMMKNPGKVVTQYDFMTLFSKAWYKAMTIPNVMSAFRTTGVHPFNKEVVSVTEQKKFDPRTLPTATGLAYIPLYSPMGKTSKARVASTDLSDPLPSFSDDSYSCSFEDNAPDDSHQDEHGEYSSELESDVPIFSEELTLFHKRLEEGFDLVTDDRYNLWLSIYSPQDRTESSDVPTVPKFSKLLVQTPMTLKKFLPPSPPQMRQNQVYEKSSAKVLTSRECIQAMEEKERLKNEKQKEKEQRKQEKEKKKLEKKSQTGKYIVTQAGWLLPIIIDRSQDYNVNVVRMRIISVALLSVCIC